MSNSADHSIVCFDKNLPRGVRQERSWGCICGEKYGSLYDNAALKAHREHRKTAARRNTPMEVQS